MSGHVGTRWAIVKPCGTDAAYRRHYRRGTKPCQRCIDAHQLAVEERGNREEENAARRERYAAARASGMTRDEAGRFAKRTRARELADA